MFELKPEYEITQKRFDAFWQREIIDRPPVSLVVPKRSAKKLPEKQYSCHEERWLDIDFRVELINTELENSEYLGDALPIAVPNMGPEIFSAWCGCKYYFGDTTTWSEPCIKDWEQDRDNAVLDMNHPLFLKTVEFTEKLLERGRGRFITGLTDFHPGGDHLAALRDPQHLAMDMIENVDYVKEKIRSSHNEFIKAYQYFYEMLRQEDLPITTWTPLIYEGLFYIPSNDFSCMISKEMFNDIFLEGIAAECRFYEKSIYHLDGPGALKHLDSLLEINELDAVQWVPGAGNEGYHKWVEVYKKIQQKGKLIQIWVDKSELSMVFETLKPEGVWFSEIKGVDDQETADEVLRRIGKWK